MGKGEGAEGPSGSQLTPRGLSLGQSTPTCFLSPPEGSSSPEAEAEEAEEWGEDVCALQLGEPP